MYTRTNRTWLAVALVLSAVLLIAHVHALANFWYWKYRWSDIPMHILGGAALGSFIFAFGTTRRTGTYFLCILVLFVFWKGAEYFGHVSYAQPYQWLENFKDLVTSFIGACIPFVIGRKTTWR